MSRLILLLIFIFSFSLVLPQYPPAAGEKESDAVYADSSLVFSWAASVRIIPGYINISDKMAGKVEYNDSSLVLGKADNRTVSLGDGGIAILGFDVALTNNYGHDFAIFENSFDGSFLELAIVEVSSDSSRWVEFPSVSLTATDNQIGGFGQS